MTAKAAEDGCKLDSDRPTTHDYNGFRHLIQFERLVTSYYARQIDPRNRRSSLLRSCGNQNASAGADPLNSPVRFLYPDAPGGYSALASHPIDAVASYQAFNAIT